MVFRSQSARSLNLIWWKLLNFCLCFLSCRMGIYRVVRIKSGHSLAYLEPCNSIIAIITYTNANMYITFEIYKRYMELCLMQCSLAFFPALQFNLLHIEYWLILNFNMLQINIFSYTSLSTFKIRVLEIKLLTQWCAHLEFWLQSKAGFFKLKSCVQLEVCLNLSGLLTPVINSHLDTFLVWRGSFSC